MFANTWIWGCRWLSEDDKAREDRTRKADIPSPLDDAVWACFCWHYPFLAHPYVNSLRNTGTVTDTARHKVVSKLWLSQGFASPRTSSLRVIGKLMPLSSLGAVSPCPKAQPSGRGGSLALFRTTERVSSWAGFLHWEEGGWRTGLAEAMPGRVGSGERARFSKSLWPGQDGVGWRDTKRLHICWVQMAGSWDPFNRPQRDREAISLWQKT